MPAALSICRQGYSCTSLYSVEWNRGRRSVETELRPLSLTCSTTHSQPIVLYRSSVWHQVIMPPSVSVLCKSFRPGRDCATYFGNCGRGSQMVHQFTEPLRVSEITPYATCVQIPCFGVIGACLACCEANTQNTFPRLPLTLHMS